jgi:alpha-tubulin suppressor-like RCC1 family protein
VASVTIAPGTVSVVVGGTATLVATPRDAQGNPININVTTWATNNSAVATVSSTGVVTGVSEGGPVTITAQAGTVSGTAYVTVTAVPIATIEVTSATTSFEVGETMQMTAIAKSANGAVLADRSVEWSSSNNALATVNASGLVTAIAAGNVIITASAEGKSGTRQLEVTAAPLTLAAITTGGFHSCALLSDGSARCWGVNANGQIGDGTTTNRLQATQVAGGHRFKKIAAGSQGTCGITIADQALCWGKGQNGNLGNGQTSDRHLPDSVTPIAEPFIQIAPSPATNSTCAITATSKLYCWGYDPSGQLTGSPSVRNPTLLPTGNTPPIVELSVGETFGCGRTAAGASWCWGLNNRGQLGDGTTTLKTAPVTVLGGHVFTMLRSGSAHSCGLRNDGTIWCWGKNDTGQLGDGSEIFRTTPVQAGSFSDYVYVSAGMDFSCGVRTGGSAWCWGSNNNGQLGDGTKIDRALPIQVGGGKSFSALASGVYHTCGIASDGVYCWGANSGQVGDGTEIARLTPVKVMGLP